MATYVNDLRLKEIATGDEAGTWGASTNTNLELIGEALGYGTQNCFSSNANATTTVADGASDPARAMYFKVTSSATLTATRTLTIAPNTISRVMLIENATTGGQSIAISQGSGANVTIANGAVKMVYLDGAGAGAAVVDALADLELGTITVSDLTATTADINGGAIDGTAIGANSASTGAFTTLTASGDVNFDSGTFFVDASADAVGIGTTSPTSKLHVEDTSTKTYPTTADFTATPGLYQNIEVSTNQVVNSTTPGGFNFVYGFRNELTKSAGNTTDIDRLYFVGFWQELLWDDLNTCKQYLGVADRFTYSGIDANGRTSFAFFAETTRLVPPDGGTQTITTLNAKNSLTVQPAGTSTVSITNSNNITPALNFFSLDAGTKTVNITNHTFLGNGQFTTFTSAGTLNATITNLYGLRLTAPSSSTGLTVTNNWGIRQEWSSAKNWFAGASNQFPNLTTTASSANAFLDTGDSNRLYVSTSSIEYKTDVENLDPTYADNILNLRPVWYRSTASADPAEWSYYGLIAEEVAAVEPRLVHYGYKQSDYEEVVVTEEVRIDESSPAYDEANPDKTVTVEKTERRLKDGSVKAPNGVAYERLSVMLLDIIKRQSQQIEALEARVAALEP